MKQKRGLFIVFEGGEGSGKSSQAKLLVNFLESQRLEVLLTKEPGGDAGICKDIREILLNAKNKGKISHRAELLLFEADRAQHVEYVVKPALDDGKIVVCDRFDVATRAYQCGARGVCTTEEFEQINNFATGGLTPDFYIYIDIDPQIGINRKVKEGILTRFEEEDLEFHKRVRQGYLDFFDKLIDKSCWQKLDGELSIEELHKQILNALRTKRLI